jgi:hypothetical protein
MLIMVNLLGENINIGKKTREDNIIIHTEIVCGLDSSGSG